ncbi:MAG: substrate-binding domain-containing protein [Verrucomicrobiota bacterium]
MSTIIHKKNGYRLVQEVVREKIASGEWRVGHKLPSERDLEKKLGLSRLTISKGLTGLADEGLLERRRGQGTFVAARTKNGSVKGSVIKYICPALARDIIVHHDVLSAMHDGLDEAGYHVGVAFYRTFEEKADLLRRDTDEAIGGFIVTFDQKEPILEELNRLNENNFPLVLIDSYPYDTKLDFSVTNNIEGGRMMVDHLAGLGHRRIAYITRPVDRSSLRDRQAGFVQGMLGNNLPLWPEGIMVLKSSISPHPREEAVACTDRLLSLPEPPTAIFFSNDDMALAVKSHLSARGIRVPEDISIAGYDNIDQSADIKASLTTIKQDFYQMGRMAAEILKERVENRNRRPQTLFIKPELIIRGSTAPAPAP